ncbi:hypothetical protein CMI42_00180 [Candidatus Pacearchaeota archaeon]|nr:hypothetical protein [Candidatus Pacearchaeota archaeon]|tara:strand:+ start:699 stop:881 length:183 start_codon:yes stop_codon:yes gene_type:complete
MEQESLPSSKKELKEFILETVREANGGSIPFLSDEEQAELEGLHGDSLDEPRNLEDYEPL